MAEKEIKNKMNFDVKKMMEHHQKTNEEMVRFMIQSMEAARMDFENPSLEQINEVKKKLKERTEKMNNEEKKYKPRKLNFND